LHPIIEMVNYPTKQTDWEKFGIRQKLQQQKIVQETKKIHTPPKGIKKNLQDEHFPHHF